MVMDTICFVLFKQIYKHNGHSKMDPAPFLFCLAKEPSMEFFFLPLGFFRNENKLE